MLAAYWKRQGGSRCPLNLIYKGGSMKIYKVTNRINGKSYIGLTTESLQERKYHHVHLVKKGSGYYLHNAIRKYGIMNFDWIILEHNISDFSILKELEIYWIREFDTKIPNGYNMTDGGDGSNGYKWTEERRKRPIIVSEETKRKLSEANKGRKFGPMSKEAIQKRTEARRRNGTNKQTDETRKKISETLKKRKSSL